MYLLAFLIIAATVWLILKRFQTHAVLFFSGFLLLSLAFFHARLFGSNPAIWQSSPTGWFFFDLFAIVKERLSTRTASIGMVIMAAGGFARYMSHISASQALVRTAIRPLAHIRNPYVLLALAYAVGQCLNVFVPSAAGLAMLLLVAMYPTLVQLGIRPAAAAAVIGTTACLDLGPASPASNVAATVAGLEPIVYFARYQIPVALVTIPAIALLHAFWQRFCDRTAPEDDSTLALNPDQNPAQSVPPFYALLPVLPLILLLVFSPLMVASIQLDVVTAMLVSLFVCITCEALRLRSLRTALAGITEFFKGMGDIFAKVVTLIIAAETFATGVQSTGLIDALIHSVDSLGLGPHVMLFALICLIGFTAALTGSGNAALFSFSHLIPNIAAPMGTSTLFMMLPTQLAAGLFRSVSPVAGVIIAVAATANVSPFAIIKRTSVPMLGGTLVMLIAHSLFSMALI